jgi:hypothetical protein
MKKPQLETQISDYTFHNQNRMKIAHIKVRNKPVRFLSRWMNRDLATDCRGVVRVNDASNGQLIKGFSGLKWAMNPEPLKVEPMDDRSFVMMRDPVIMMTAGLKNIGERWEDLDIAVKHEGDHEFYVNTPQNYPLNLKPSETRIGGRRCWVDVTMEFVNGRSTEKRYYLRNDSEKIIDFELSERPFATPQSPSTFSTSSEKTAKQAQNSPHGLLSPINWYHKYIGLNTGSWIGASVARQRSAKTTRSSCVVFFSAKPR